MKRLPKIKCDKCDGSGKVPMSWELNEVLSLATNTDGITAISAKEKLDKDNNFHPSAFNNRLNHLVDLNLMRRERQGRNWVYFRN